MADSYGTNFSGGETPIIKIRVKSSEPDINDLPIDEKTETKKNSSDDDDDLKTDEEIKSEKKNKIYEAEIIIGYTRKK